MQKDESGWIVNGGVSELWGGTGIEVYMGMMAERPRDFKYLLEYMAGKGGND